MTSLDSFNVIILGKQMKKIGSYLVVTILAFSAGMVVASVLQQSDGSHQASSIPNATVDNMGNVSSR